jgi:hypothetical protein
MTPDPTGEVIASVDYDADVLRLMVDTAGGWYLALDNDFVVHASAGERIDSASEPKRAVALLREHVGGKLTAFAPRDGGGLTIGFDGVQVSVEPAHDFEAWHLTGPPPDKQMIVCMPGGELAIWS